MLIEIKPADHLVASCVGKPGNRTFYIQASQEDEILTILCEKFQVQQLATGITRFVRELQETFPDLEPAVADYSETEMELEAPIEPIFRVGQMGLGYEKDRDLLVLVAQELVGEEDDPEEASQLRVFATRSQMLAMGACGAAVAARGRPICGNCLQPMDPEAHFCPGRNGHKQ